MTKRTLEDLLESTDAAMPPPRLPAGIAATVRHRARRRAAGKRAGGLAVLAFALVAVSLYRSRPASKDDSSLLRSEYAQLDAEARVHEMIAERLMQVPAALPAPQRSVDVSVRLSADRNCTAGMLVARGDRLQKNIDTRAAGEDSYKRVIELFPETLEASVAAKRLQATKT